MPDLSSILAAHGSRWDISLHEVDAWVAVTQPTQSSERVIAAPTILELAVKLNAITCTHCRELVVRCPRAPDRCYGYGYLHDVTRRHECAGGTRNLAEPVRPWTQAKGSLTSGTEPASAGPVAAARDLLRQTAELPGTLLELLTVLGRYRRVLHDLLDEEHNRQKGRSRALARSD